MGPLAKHRSIAYICRLIKKTDEFTSMTHKPNHVRIRLETRVLTRKQANQKYRALPLQIIRLLHRAKLHSHICKHSKSNLRTIRERSDFAVRLEQGYTMDGIVPLSAFPHLSSALERLNHGVGTSRSV